MTEKQLTREDLINLKAITKILMGMNPENDLIETMGMDILNMVNSILKDWDKFPAEKKAQAADMFMTTMAQVRQKMKES